MNYGFHTEGAAELEEAIRYYEAQKAELGRQFLDEVARTISTIRRFPEAAPLVSKRSRRCRVRRFPYGLIYQIRNEQIAILAVMHLHRRPGYWMHKGIVATGDPYRTTKCDQAWLISNADN